MPGGLGLCPLAGVTRPGEAGIRSESDGCRALTVTWNPFPPTPMASRHLLPKVTQLLERGLKGPQTWARGATPNPSSDRPEGPGSEPGTQPRPLRCPQKAQDRPQEARPPSLSPHAAMRRPRKLRLIFKSLKPPQALIKEETPRGPFSVPRGWGFRKLRVLLGPLPLRQGSGSQSIWG